MTETRSQDAYTQLKTLLVGYSVAPGARLNEGSLAQQLGVSRTPLREALNRLMAERLVEFRAGQGFFCRALDPQTIFDLYELRRILEGEAVALACARATGAALTALDQETRQHGLSVAGLTVVEAVARDEAFHLGIAEAAGNAALVAQLENLNDRLRFIRWVNMAARVEASKGEHLAVLEALCARNADAARRQMQDHIARRMDQVVQAVKEGISSLHLGEADALLNKRLEGA